LLLLSVQQRNDRMIELNNKPSLGAKDTLAKAHSKKGNCPDRQLAVGAILFSFSGTLVPMTF